MTEKRTNMLNFVVSDAELQTLQEKMKRLGIRNQSAFLRSMALNGYILRLDLPEIRELTRLLSNMTGNINQIAKRENAGGHIYETELYEIQENQQQLWKIMRQILTRLEGIT